MNKLIMAVLLVFSSSVFASGGGDSPPSTTTANGGTGIGTGIGIGGAGNGYGGEADAKAAALAAAAAKAAAFNTTGVDVQTTTYLYSSNKTANALLSAAKTGDVDGKTGDNTNVITVEGDDNDFPVNTAYAAGLVASGSAICMGSSSGGGSGSALSVSIATTWEAKHCQMLLASAQFFALDMRLSAAKRMCFVGGEIQLDNAIAMYNEPFIYREKIFGGFKEHQVRINCNAIKTDYNKQMEAFNKGKNKTASADDWFDKL